MSNRPVYSYKEQASQSRELAQLWRSRCIQPLRDIRRQMKVSTPTDSIAAPWLHIREQVKAIELASEKRLLEGLETIACVVDVSSDAQPLADIALANLDRCLHLQQIISMPAMAAIATILCAAYPELQYHALIQSMQVLTSTH